MGPSFRPLPAPTQARIDENARLNAQARRGELANDVVEKKKQDDGDLLSQVSEHEAPGNGDGRPSSHSSSNRLSVNLDRGPLPMIQDELERERAEEQHQPPSMQQDREPHPLIEEEPAPQGDKEVDGPRRRPATAEWWRKQIENSFVERRRKETQKVSAAEAKEAARKASRQRRVERKAETARIGAAARQEGWKANLMWKLFGALPGSIRRERKQAAAQDAAKRPAAGARGPQSRLAKAVAIGGTDGSAFEPSGLAKGLRAYGGYVANRDGRPGDEDPLLQGTYDVAKAKKDFDFMKMNMIDTPRDYYTSAMRAIGQAAPAKEKTIGLQNLPPMSVMATVQPRVGLMAMNAGGLVNSMASDSEKVGHDARLRMAKHLDRMGRSSGKEKFRDAVRAVVQNQKLAKARRAQGMATIPARSMDETAAMNNRTVTWDPDVKPEPGSEPKDLDTTGPLQMPRIGAGEEPMATLGGEVATGVNKLGGLLGHTGRIIDNTDKGWEEHQAGRPGLGLAKSTAATAVWATRKAVTAPVKNIPLPGMDVLGGELGKAAFTAGGMAVEGIGKGLRQLTEKAELQQRRAHAYREYVGESAPQENEGALPRGVIGKEGEQGGESSEDLEALRSDYGGGDGTRQERNWQSLRDRALAQGVTFGPQFAKQGVEKDGSAWTNYRQGDVRDEVKDGVRVPFRAEGVKEDETAPASIKDNMTAMDKRSANAAGLPQQSIGWGEYMAMRGKDRAKKAKDDMVEYATLPRDQYKKAGGLLWQGLTSAGGDSAWVAPKIRQQRRDASEIPNAPQAWAGMSAEQRREQVTDEKWSAYEADYRRERQAAHDDKLIWDEDAAKAGRKPSTMRKLLFGDRRERIPAKGPQVNFHGRPNLLKADDSRLIYHGQTQVDALTQSLDDYIATRQFGTRNADPKPEPEPDMTLDEARTKGAEMLRKSELARADASSFQARGLQDKTVKDQIKHWSGVYKKLPAGVAGRPQGVVQEPLPVIEEEDQEQDLLPLLEQRGIAENGIEDEDKDADYWKR